MTRETKIGLLAGLGSIVVFAVVLSHTGAPHPPGDGLQLVQRPDESLDILTPDELEQINPTPADVPARQVEDIVALPEPMGSQPLELPSPDELTTPMDFLSNTFASDKLTRPVADIETNDRTTLIHLPRLAPTVDDPTPSHRDGTPSVSPTPAPGPTAPNLEPDQPPTKLYVVQKRDTLGGIAERHYGTSKPKVVQYLVKNNKDRIKSKDIVIEGQEIVIPELPSDMFEPAPDFQASDLQRNERLVLNAEVPKKPNERVAPNQDPAGLMPLPISAGRSEYTVQPGDTLVKIAREQLGSDAQWQEIQKLNKNLDPKKLKPGMEIRLPARRPVSRSENPKRVAA